MYHPACDRGSRCAFSARNCRECVRDPEASPSRNSAGKVRLVLSSSREGKLRLSRWAGEEVLVEVFVGVGM